MGKHCQTCSHPSRITIDAELRQHTASIRDLARKWKIDRSSLQRHSAKHLDREVALSQGIPTIVFPKQSDGRVFMVELASDLEISRKYLDRADREGNSPAALAWQRQHLITVETAGRLGYWQQKVRGEGDSAEKTDAAFTEFMEKHREVYLELEKTFWDWCAAKVISDADEWDATAEEDIQLRVRKYTETNKYETNGVVDAEENIIEAEG